MNESSIKCVGGVLYGISHPSHVDAFIYTDITTGMSTKYTKKIMHEQMFFVADHIDKKFIEQLVIYSIK